ncbi:MAG: nitroreductase family deazaflavin-dependent oxidoreductase [Actinobacteria bacterium]|nr:nitroreductase family deazaflavin-dependent oxidoreductase [Actinomycetota bacterium]
MGSRVCMVEHVGRASGQRRFVCLEVVERPNRDTFVLVSGFGRRAQWYRNLAANPQCWITVGRERRSAKATLLDAADSAQRLSRYQQTHPRAWENLKGAIEEATGRPATTLPMVRIDRA